MPLDSSPAQSRWNLRDAPAFCALDLPPRESLLGPVLVQNAIALMRGPKGVGKSQLALQIALAVAAGGQALGWQAPAARNVLYLDADTPLALLQERVRRLSHGAPPSTLTMFAADEQDEMPSLGWVGDLNDLESQLAGMDLLVLDGLSSLMARGPRGGWQYLAQRLRTWRRQGLTVLLVEGPGLKGKARALENLVEVTLALAPRADRDPRTGLACEVLIEGARLALGPAAAPLRVDLAAGSWRVTDKDQAETKSMLELCDSGYSIREIADVLGMSKSRVHRLIKRAVETGTDGPARHSPQSEGGTVGTPGTLGTDGTPGTAMSKVGEELFLAAKSEGPEALRQFLADLEAELRRRHELRIAALRPRGASRH